MPFDFHQMGKLTSKRQTLPNGDDLGYVISEEETEHYHVMIDRHQRDILIERVHRNELTPVEAETYAKDRRIGPLASRLPDISELSSDMTFWTLEMTAAWIKQRTPKAVHRHHAPSYMNRWVWEKLPTFHENGQIFLPWQKPRPASAKPCYKLGELEKTCVGRTYVDFDGETKSLKGLSEFMPQMKAQLAEGKILAVGQTTGQQYLSPRIDPAFWETAEFSTSDADGLFLVFNDKVIYREIRFRSSDILKRYPDLRAKTRPSESLPWKRSIDLIEYKREIIETLMVYFPKGLPVWRPKKIRDYELRSILPVSMLVRWYPNGMTDVKDDSLTKQHNAFGKAMDRMLEAALVMKETLK